MRKLKIVHNKMWGWYVARGDEMISGIFDTEKEVKAWLARGKTPMERLRWHMKHSGNPAIVGIPAMAGENK